MNKYKIFLLPILFLSTLWMCSEKKRTQTVENEAGTLDNEKIVDQSQKIILCFGNSITAGYQLDMDEAFPAILQRMVDSLGWSYTVINAGLSGETSASGRSRIEWTLQSVPDIFILELGANDALRGLPLDQTEQNLSAIIYQVMAVNPEVELIIAGMKVPPNLGQEYTMAFDRLFPTLARKYEAVLIPFLLEGVAGESNLNLPDGIHPTAEGHQILAKTIWPFLEPLIKPVISE